MTEREQIVAWLDREIAEYAGAPFSEFMELIRDGILRGDHMEKPDGK